MQCFCVFLCLGTDVPYVFLVMLYIAILDLPFECL